MTHVNEGQASLRHAALSLHALGEQDRAWILDALPAAQKSALQPLLTELRELGIPRDAGLLEDLVPIESPQAAPWAVLERLDARSIAALARMLREEPPRIAATLLGSRQWTWRTQLLAFFDSAFAAEVQRCATVPGSSPGLQEAVQQAIRHRLCPPMSAVRPRLWHRCKDALRRRHA